MEIKIAHFADVHLGAESRCLGKLSETRRLEIKHSFFKMIDIISSENVDLVLAAGDLFHDVNVSSTDVKEVKSAFGRINSRIVISPGNHDPFTVDSPYWGIWPENVHIFKSQEFVNFEIKELNVVVWGAAFTHSSGLEIKIPKDITIDNSFLNILLVHGTLSNDKSGIYNPINLVDIKNSGMNYVALGHIHKRTPILRQGNTFYSYPGCLEGRSFGELGEKGFYLGTISDQICNLEFIKMSERIYAEVHIDVTDFDNSSDVISSIISEIKETFGVKHKDNIYKIVLEGTVSEELLIDVNYIEKNVLEYVFFGKVCDNTKLLPSLLGQDLKSIFFKKMKEQIDIADNDEDRKILSRALKLGILSFSREVGYDDN